MLTLSNLRPLRVSKDVSRVNLSILSDISVTRLKELELKTCEPWYDEALRIARVMSSGAILPLMLSDSLTTSDLGIPLENDLTLWGSSTRTSLSHACRVAKRLGLSDPAMLDAGPLARQIWDIVGANDRHPAHAGICPWCVADVGMGEAHRETCLPNVLYARDAGPGLAPSVLRPETKGERRKGVPAKNLKVHRMARMLLQKDIADVLGIHANYYARLERADIPLTIEHADKLAAYYGVDRAVLYAPQTTVPAQGDA